MTSVTVNRRVNAITVKNTGGVFTPSSSAVTIQNQGTIAAAAARLDQLDDIVESSPANNATLVYNSTDDKYYVQQLDLDGGTF